MPSASELLGKAVQPAELIAYQADSIVSRILLKSSGGSVTAFAFDVGQELSEHTAPFDALVMVVDGETEIRISGQSNLLKAGEMIVLPANEPHALKATSPFKMILTMLRVVD